MIVLFFNVDGAVRLWMRSYYTSLGGQCGWSLCAGMKNPKPNEYVTIEPTIEWIGHPPADCPNADYLEHGIRETMRSLFGEFGASVPLEVVSYEPAGCRATLRVPADTAGRVTAALTLCSQLLGAACVVHVHGQPPVAAAPKRYFCA